MASAITTGYVLCHILSIMENELAMEETLLIRRYSKVTETNQLSLLPQSVVLVGPHLLCVLAHVQPAKFLRDVAR